MKSYTWFVAMLALCGWSLVPGSRALAHGGSELAVLDCEEEDKGDSSRTFDCEDEDGDDAGRTFDCEDEDGDDSSRVFDCEDEEGDDSSRVIDCEDEDGDDSGKSVLNVRSCDCDGEGDEEGGE